MTLLAAALVLGLAAFAQSATGFGFNLVAVPLLSVLGSPRDAVVAGTLVSVVQMWSIAVVDRGIVDHSLVRRLVPAIAAGAPFGLVVLAMVSESQLTVLISVVTIVAAVWVGMRVTLPPRGLLPAGLVSGILLTSTATSGPPLVAALQGLHLAPARFRGTLVTIFAFVNTGASVAFACLGWINMGTLHILLVALPAVWLGNKLGRAAVAAISVETFRRLVLMTMVGAATTSFVHAVA